MDLFSSPARRDAVLSDPRCLRARYDPGAEIYTPERFEQCLGLVLSGNVRVTKEALVMRVLRAGDLFGAAALFRGGEDAGEYTATLTALSECEVALLPEGMVRDLMRTEDGFAERYLTYLTGRLRYLSARLDVLSAGEAPRRLAQYLISNMDQDAKLRMPAAELARHLSMGRATLYRAFAALERTGFLRRDGKTIVVLAPCAVPHSFY